MGKKAIRTETRAPIRDHYGRGFETLRLSLTPDCNLACVYCVAEEDAHAPLRGHVGLEPEEYIRLVRRVQTHVPLHTVRLTGGEPLLYPSLSSLIAGLKDLGIERISLTTNALLLPRRMQELTAAGLDSVNVSLDTLDPVVFARIARRAPAGLGRVLEGIEAARASGLPVKLNMTVYRGVNDGEIVDVLRFAGSRGMIVRYLELMNMGPLYRGAADVLVTEAEILERIRAESGEIEPLERRPAATANYWRALDGSVFGVIANHSAPFCRDCNRLRMDSEGRLYGCLSDNRGLRLDSGGEGEADRQLLGEALRQKQSVRFTGSDLSMKEIGG